MEENNLACILLQSGDFGAAHHALQRALLSLKDELRQQAISESESTFRCSAASYSREEGSESLPEVTCNDDGDGDDDMDCETLPSKSMQSVPVVAALCPRTNSHTTNISMYNRAFILSIDEEEWNFEYKQWASAIVFYNMGLVHHSKAAHTSNDSYLRIALRFYDMATSLVDLINASDDFNMMLLKSAITNNTAHCHACLFDVCGAELAFQELQRLLNKLSDQLDVEDYSVFFLNTILQVSCLRLAPAA